jgi:hypothetical protein
MKKFFLTMMFAVAAMAGMAQTIGEAFYIYRHDGRCYTFLRNQVDSIVYSHISTDGVFHDEVVTQLIFTKDSISKMPLLEVEGIGFVKMEEFYTSCPDHNHPHMIDLGLPSGTLWACCNVGASAPEEYGNYYAWGETQPKSVYNWDTNRWGSAYNKLTKYNTESDFGTVDGKTTLDASDDAATANWGVPWRMPSLAQIEELLNNTTSTWTTENGVYGRKFKGPNGGSVFLPAAGLRWYSGLRDAGSYGYYWSSTLNESYPECARSLGFGSGYAGWYDYSRYTGQSVRPVR